MEPKNKKIGIILISEGNPFFDELLDGIKTAADEVGQYGVDVIVRTMKGYDAMKQIFMIDKIKNDCDILILNPIDSTEVINKINSLVDEGMQVVTVNTDVNGSKRLCHIGNDYTKSGRTAAGVMGLITGGKGKIGIVTGSKKILGHNQRIQGFIEVINKKYPNLNVLAIVENDDDELKSYDMTTQMLKHYNDMDSLFIAAGGAYGSCSAVINSGRDKSFTIISFDSTPAVRELMEKGIIKATICQQPYEQGYRAVKCAFAYVVNGDLPDDEIMYVRNDILIEENMNV